MYYLRGKQCFFSHIHKKHILSSEFIITNYYIMPPAKKTPVAKVTENARHIEENKKDIQNNSKMIHLLYGVIIVLMLVIAGLAFYVGTIFGGPNTWGSQTPTNTQTQDINITVIDDSRCGDCQTDAIVGQLKQLPFLSQATFIEKDFWDDGIELYMKNNNITLLPAVIFNTNGLYDGGQLTPYLTALSDGQYSLALGAKFNPFQKRSDNGFLMLETSQIEDIKKDSVIDGNPSAKITWIEYSDLECPFCAKLHNEGTPDTIKEKYGNDLNIVFQHFPLDFHDDALPAAQALECIAEQNPAIYHNVIAASYEKYSSNNFSLSGFYDLAAESGINKTVLESCVNSGKFEEKALAQMAAGQELFGITGTPGFLVAGAKISGDQPYAVFQQAIEAALN